MSTPRLVLASASPTRLRILRQAGFDPIVDPAHVDETFEGDVAGGVVVLAERKAAAVAPRFPGDVVLGCDSLVDLDGRVLGKPASAAQASEWWQALRGREATVWTGQCVVIGEGLTVRADSATLRFGMPSDAEIDRFVASGDWEGAAGGFRLHGRSGPFIESIAGHPSTISGVSMPALRAMLGEMGIQMSDLWV